MTSSDEFKLKFPQLRQAELERLQAETNQAWASQFLSRNQADSMYINKNKILPHVKNYIENFPVLYFFHD